MCLLCKHLVCLLPKQFRKQTCRTFRIQTLPRTHSMRLRVHPMPSSAFRHLSAPHLHCANEKPNTPQCPKSAAGTPNTWIPQCRNKNKDKRTPGRDSQIVTKSLSKWLNLNGSHRNKTSNTGERGKGCNLPIFSNMGRGFKISTTLGKK